MSELKKCPMCGSNKLGILTHKFDGVDRFHRVECTECELATGLKYTKQEAIAAWNRRANDE
ncbi:Lar family restriction alleviation protein [Providencia rettgeri]|uniref:Lar family restriction alleviation protein n=1 Tax=Providencia rettgeri TaxID=587 RepID=UPI003B75C86B